MNQCSFKSLKKDESMFSGFAAFSTTAKKIVYKIFENFF